MPIGVLDFYPVCSRSLFRFRENSSRINKADSITCRSWRDPKGAQQMRFLLGVLVGYSMRGKKKLDDPFNFDAWADDSFELGQQVVYLGIRSGRRPNGAYNLKAIKVARKRVAWVFIVWQRCSTRSGPSSHHEHSRCAAPQTHF